ncbi:putative lipase/calmodulin-binding heat-shock protein [Dioscorea alata]|uniref:Lipase/calmodulin-binding heat-shock protein n=1 Tax=Dioscorea alata TaxID=55571 RepID=A0ACB7V055_DIOAL|nr:putative lipase/calmodulin-binding heat-shock protein [Dioscorea alata]
MATATMATAAGVAMLLYFVLSRRLSARDVEDVSKPGKAGRRRVALRRPAQAPATWREAASTLAETLRFAYTETLGKWPIGDLAFGIKYLMRRQGNLHVARVYAGSDCVQLKGPGIMLELIHLLRLLNLCLLFSKKPFYMFLETAGYSQADVLLQEAKAGLLKPAFTIIRDERSKCFLLIIRGTHSIKDTLTAATGAVVPFHHSVLDEGGVSNLVLGYAHCGMVAAAHCIAKRTTPILRKALSQHPDYSIKIVGHSLGGGTAALLAYILREHKEFCSSTCVAFAPAACMTWDLAESGKQFITTVINGSDLVPTFSTASIDELRSEVTASSWLNDLRDQVQHTRFLNVVYRSASALGSRLPSISGARARVAGAGALLQPVSSKTQVVMKQAQNVAQAVVRTRSSLSSWSCIGARRRVIGASANSKEDDVGDSRTLSQANSDTLLIKQVNSDTDVDAADFSSSRDSDHEESEEDEPIKANGNTRISIAEEMTDGELWFELEKELHRREQTEKQVREEEAAAAKEITEEENVVLMEAVENKQPMSSDGLERHQFFPPGKIMHMVAMPLIDPNTGEEVSANDDVGIYETPRDLYSKIRLSRTMINDHYMPMYKKMMELLIEKLEMDECEEDAVDNNSTREL